MGRPKIVPDNVTVALVDLCKVLRSFQMPVFHTTVIAHFKRLTDGTELGRKFQKKSGDGWDWHEGKLDNWFKRHFWESTRSWRRAARCPLMLRE